MRRNDEFEGWARSRSMDLEYRNIPGVGQYYECPRTLLAMESWQASRQSLVVDFAPVREEANHHSFGGEEAVFSAAVKAIQAVGIKVKEQ